MLLVMLSLSIGWGIRGNYGAEYGAMLAGALSATAAALMSGREDWRQRVPFFAFFGALGWGFGGSIAYMVPLSYTETGQLATQAYGYFATFLEGFLWAAIGGAATAYAAVEDRENLTAMFRPLLWVFGFWALQYTLEDTPFGLQHRWFGATGADQTWFRQRDPLYWFDSEWVEAAYALTALCLFDLWDRRFSKLGHLAGMLFCGAAVGFGVQWLLAAAGWQDTLVSALMHPQGDVSLLDPATGAPKFSPDDMLTNWPAIFVQHGAHLGCCFGAVAGAALYFWRYGAWRSGSALLLRMALWSMIVFVAGPVLLSNLPCFAHHGGFRLAPPRGDSWANILGCLVGLLLYFRKTRQHPVVFATLLSGALGGLALTTAEFVKVLCCSPGNPHLTSNPLVIQAWQHWRSANWHSLAREQFAGFLYGLAIVVPLGLLASRLPLRRAEPRLRPRTEIVAVVFVFNILTYLNVVKNIEDWTAPRKIAVNGAGGLFRSVAETLRAPLFGTINLSAWSWFTLMWVAFTAATIFVLVRNRRQPVALLPATWLGKGQLLYLMFLWLMVIANFTKALVSFSDNRIATEATIMFNALVCTVLILGWARQREPEPLLRQADFARFTRRSLATLAAVFVATLTLYTSGVRALYGNNPTDSIRNLRFGPDADWRLKPILKSKHHT